MPIRRFLYGSWQLWLWQPQPSSSIASVELIRWPECPVVALNDSSRCRTTQCQRDLIQRRGQSTGPADHIVATVFGSRSVKICWPQCLNSAEEPPNPKKDTDRDTFPGQIAQMTEISAMNPPRNLTWQVGQQFSPPTDRNTITSFRLGPTAFNSCNTTSPASGNSNVLCPIAACIPETRAELALLFPRLAHLGSITKCAEEPTLCCHFRRSPKCVQISSAPKACGGAAAVRSGRGRTVALGSKVWLDGPLARNRSSSTSGLGLEAAGTWRSRCATECQIEPLASPWIKDRVAIGVTDVDTLEENHWQQPVDF